MPRLISVLMVQDAYQDHAGMTHFHGIVGGLRTELQVMLPEGAELLEEQRRQILGRQQQRQTPPLSVLTVWQASDDETEQEWWASTTWQSPEGNSLHTAVHRLDFGEGASAFWRYDDGLPLSGNGTYALVVSVARSETGPWESCEPSYPFTYRLDLCTVPTDPGPT